MLNSCRAISCISAVALLKSHALQYYVQSKAVLGLQRGTAERSAPLLLESLFGRSRNSRCAVDLLPLNLPPLHSTGATPRGWQPPKSQFDLNFKALRPDRPIARDLPKRSLLALAASSKAATPPHPFEPYHPFNGPTSPPRLHLIAYIVTAMDGIV